jgi:hypothetical protein
MESQGLSSPAFVECLSAPALVVTSICRWSANNKPKNTKLFNSYISFPTLLVNGSQSPFALFTGLLRHRMLDCSALSHFLLLFPTSFRAFLFFSFISVTRTVFA